MHHASGIHWLVRRVAILDFEVWAGQPCFAVDKPRIDGGGQVSVTRKKSRSQDRLAVMAPERRGGG
jgi:hypothetical protein